jgi:hypothetical protein
MGSPKSPKVRSITDKGNTSPRAIICIEGLKSDKKNPVTKRTPKSNLKNNFYDLKIFTYLWGEWSD